MNWHFLLLHDFGDGEEILMPIDKIVAIKKAKVTSKEPQEGEIPRICTMISTVAGPWAVKETTQQIKMLLSEAEEHDKKQMKSDPQ